MSQSYDRAMEIEKFIRFIGKSSMDANEQMVLEDIYDDAAMEALGYCNRDDIHIGMSTSIRDLAKIRYNQQGSEGETSRSEGGVSVTFEAGIPRKIRSQLNKYRVAKVGRIR
nr:phage head-tail connector protein [uncultured Trichococcus sp.]